MWNFVLKEILIDYGDLILDCKEPDRLEDMVFKKKCATPLELIQWCVRKEFLQQALTLLDSKLPSMLVGKRDEEKRDKPVMIDSEIKDDVEKRYALILKEQNKGNMVKGQDWQCVFLIHYLNDNEGYKAYCLNRGNRVLYPSRHERGIRNLVDFISENPSNPIYSSCERTGLEEILRLYQSIKDERNGINHASNKNGHSNEPMNKAEVEKLLKEAVTRLRGMGVE